MKQMTVLKSGSIESLLLVVQNNNNIIIFSLTLEGRRHAIWVEDQVDGW